MSPVKCKLISSIGITCEYPPPVAPPLIPKTGPKEGSLSTTNDFLPILFKASLMPILVVVLPSPVGAQTSIILFLLLKALSTNSLSSLKPNSNKDFEMILRDYLLLFNK